MKKLNKSLLAQVFAVSLLGMGMTACNNADNAAETEEEAVESTSVETENNADMAAVEEDHDMADHDMTETEEHDMDMEDHDMTEDHDMSETETEGEIDTGMLDQDQIIDGTEQEEHLSAN